MPMHGTSRLITTTARPTYWEPQILTFVYTIILQNTFCVKYKICKIIVNGKSSQIGLAKNFEMF